MSYPGFSQAGCSVMACAIYKAGSDKTAVPYCALGEAVHFNPRKMLQMCWGKDDACGVQEHRHQLWK